MPVDQWRYNNLLRLSCNPLPPPAESWRIELHNKASGKVWHAWQMSICPLARVAPCRATLDELLMPHKMCGMSLCSGLLHKLLHSPTALWLLGQVLCMSTSIHAQYDLCTD